MDDPASLPTHEVPSDVVLRRGGCDAGLRGTSPERTRRSRQTSYGSTEAPTVATSRFDDPPEQMSYTDGRSFDEPRSGSTTMVGLGTWTRGCSRLPRTDTGNGVFVEGWFRTGDRGPG
ncbi:MAG: hypothetical protein CM1200mP26_19450 [Acidimicrobiales bacterium]|nr:MAG: hypothetical protein CM1200mP26_19450 [Acidimicrobiales bacterium]